MRRAADQIIAHQASDGAITMESATARKGKVIPYFANLFPSNLASLLGFSSTFNQTQAVYLMANAANFGNDWTDTQDGLDAAVGGNLFFHPQYGALAT